MSSLSPKPVTLRRISSSVLVYALGAVLALLLQIILARTLGIEEFGKYYYALSWLLFLSLVAQAGLDQAIMRFLPAFIRENDWPHAHGLVKFSNRRVLRNGLMMGVLVFGISLLPVSREVLSLSGAFLFVALCIPMRGLIYNRQATLRAFFHTTKSILPDAILTPSIIMVGVSLFALVGIWKLDAQWAMVITTLAYAASLATGNFWQKRLLPPALELFPPRYDERHWASAGFMLLVINGTHMLVNTLDIFLVGALRGPAEVGIYSACVRIASYISFILIASYPVLAPIIARYSSRGMDHNALQEAITRAMRPIATGVFLLAGLLFWCGDLALGLFGAGFKEGWGTLNILVAGQLISALCGPATLLLSYGGHERKVAAVLALSSLINASLNFILIPQYGIEGAALVTAVTLAGGSLALMVLSLKLLRINSAGLRS